MSKTKIVKVIVKGKHIDVSDNPGLIAELLPIADSVVTEEVISVDEAKSR